MGKKKTKLTLEKKYNLTGWAFLLPAATFNFCILFLSNGTGNPAFF